ncbi:Mechanosensitive ion channel-domain-containing protein [Sphaerosporella brunnea]|uniref:Mechanosensitive ion channel-domain-containing protein n=1 Tax=Sphaerosporella brunnea TaxID=1250544 RepID=A0A5J5FBB8_9PEZI|nr:Mechanosensitive ion channel-domain-containing protein [Sphaerosporella brunnea]
MSTPHTNPEKPRPSSPTELETQGRGRQDGLRDFRAQSDATFTEHPSAPPSPNLGATLQKTRTNNTGKYGSSIYSASRTREETYRQGDDIQLQKAECVASQTSGQPRDIYRSTSKRDREFVDPDASVTSTEDLDDVANPVHNVKKAWKPPRQPATKLAKLLKKVHESSWVIRYFTYIVPVALVLLIPLLVTAIRYPGATTGGVYTKWFMIWLEVVWLSLWAGRIASKIVPYVVHVLAGAVTNGPKKWRDMAKMLEVPLTLFLWWLSIYVSFLPIMKNNHEDGNTATRYWEKNANIVLLCLFVATILNLIEKIIIQLIAISFHMRTYADRIELNKFQISSLSKLYKHAKEAEKDFEADNEKTQRNTSLNPKVVLRTAATGAQKAVRTVGDVVGKIAGDFTGRQINSSTSPQQVVLTLLQSTEGSNVLGRRLYRSFVRPDEENVHADDLRSAFTDDDEAEAAFTMFDRDLNGDISCEEMELACVEISRERKAISASLKDLDSVVGKFDDCLTFIVAVIVIMVFLSLISKSTAGVLTSASSSILALSWLFSATAQEFLASLIFVFIKHPFDVGDRVDIYNTGHGTIDTFYVREIALMYTEFKKPEGSIVQAPNSLLNTLFILNMRRTGGLAEAVPIVCKFGTTLDQIEELRERLLEFVKSEKREYQGKIITELREIPDMHSVKLNVVFFYKSNWQNELVRLQRRNKFMCTLMCCVQEIGIESPNMRWPGQRQSHPVWLQSVLPDGLSAVAAAPGGGLPAISPIASPAVASPAVPGTPAPEIVNSPISHPEDFPRRPSAFSFDNSLGRSSSIRGAKVDFSLGVKDIMAMDDSGDVWDDRPRRGLVPSSSNLRRVIEEEESAMEVQSTGSASRRSNDDHHAHNFLHRRRTLGSRDSRSRGRAADEEMAIPPVTRPASPTGSIQPIRSPPAGAGAEVVELGRI